MRRRAFLVAASGAALAAGLADWTAPRDRAIAAPGPETDPTDTTVPLRTDLATVAGTVPGITLDGTLSDSRWGDPHWQSFTTLHALDEVKDTSLYAVHDATTLYVGVRLTGEQAATVTHVSVLLRGATDGDGPYRTVTVELREVSPAPAFSSWGGDTTELTDATSEFATDDGSASCAVAVPLAELGVTGEPAGQVVSLNVVVDHEDQTRPVTSVAPTRTGDSTYAGGDTASMFTDVVDEDRAALVHLGSVAPVADGRKPAELVQPDDLTLDYVDFTHKTLTLALPEDAVADAHTVDWRGPGEEWTEVATELRPTRAGVTGTLEHPEPLAYGQYQLRVRVRARSGADRVVLVSFDRNDLMRAGDRLPANQPHPPRGDGKVTPEPPSPEVEALLALVPDRAGFNFCGVPEKPGLHPEKTFSWSVDKPDQIVATSTGTAYPNDDYPEDSELTVTNRLGEKVSYPYHEGSDGKRYFLSGHLWYLQREYVYGRLVPLAESDPLGAARVLHKFATVYQGWVPTNEYPWWSRPVEPSATPRNFWWGGVWSRWSTSQLGNMTEIGNALAIVEQTDALDVLADEVGEDVRALLINDTIEDSVEWMHTFTRRYHNMDYPSYLGLTSLSKALGDSRFIHETVEYTGEYVRRGFLFDGFWKETTLSYHQQSLNGLFKIADEAKGWSDAEDYRSPRSGRRIEDLDLLRDMSVLGASARIGNLVVYPDGKLFPMADTWASSSAGAPDFSTGSFHLGASGVTRLSRGGVSSTGPFGFLQQFPDLEVVDSSVELQEFSDSGTMQLEAVDDGATVTFAFVAEADDSYDLDLWPFHAGTYGRYEVAVDDTVVGEHDFHGTASGAADFVTLGRVDLSAGDHRIAFRCVGKHEDSDGYKMGVITLALLDEAAREARDNAEPPDDANPSQVYLLATPKYGHNQWDPLSLALWAEGQELLPDLGYTHTKYRRWSTSTIGHNTVVVDSADMTSDGEDGGSLEAFSHSDPEVQVVRASFGAGYPQTSEYRRETWSIELPGTDRHAGYVLDLFRVTGGERHEFTLNGDANRHAEMTTTTTMSEYGPYLLPPGVEVTEPETENDYGDAEGHYYGYIYVRDVQRGELTDGTWDLTLTTSVEDEAAGSSAHVLGLAGEGTELFLGQSPSLRATRLHGKGSDTNDEVEKWWLPKVVLRRDGSDLASDFITMIEPSAAGVEPSVQSIRALDHDGSEGDRAIEVTHADGTVDVIISSRTGEGSITAGGVTLTGRLGFARVTDGTASLLHLVGGTALTAPGAELTGTGPVTGTLTGTRRTFLGDEVDALVTEAEVSDWVTGHTVVVTHPDGKTHAYLVKAVAVADGATTLELDGVDPGFEIAEDGTSEMAYTPFTRWEGETTFRIDNTESTQ